MFKTCNLQSSLITHTQLTDLFQSDATIAADFISVEILGFKESSILVYYVLNLQDNSALVATDLESYLADTADANGLDPDSLSMEGMCIH